MLKLFERGRLISELLRDRGRSRRLMIDYFQRKNQARLEAILEGKKKLNISDVGSDIPISLTSWAPRAEALPLVLLSLVEQSVRPAAIHLWLCPEDQGMINSTQRDFFAEHGVLFHETNNIGPHKKWLPFVELGEEVPFVIADDDTYYPNDWFHALVKEGAEHKDQIVAHRCHQITIEPDMNPCGYSQWAKGVSRQEDSSHQLFPVGCGGVMIQPAAIHEEFRSRELIHRLCPRADDIWLKAAYLYSGFKCRKTRYDFPCLDYPGTNQSGLAIENVDQGQNDRQLQEAFRHFEINFSDLI